MRAQPGAQQRPEAFHGVRMDFAEAVTIFIAGVFTRRMVDGLVRVTPGLQTAINVVFVGIDGCAGHNGLQDQGFDGGLLHVAGHPDDDFPGALDHAEDGRLFRRQGAASRRTLQAAATGLPSGLGDLVRLAFVACNDVDFVAFGHPR